MAEANDLDGKSELPPLKGLPQTDFPEDVAAMASRSTPPPLNARLRTLWPWYGLPGRRSTTTSIRCERELTGPAGNHSRS